MLSEGCQPTPLRISEPIREVGIDAQQPDDSRAYGINDIREVVGDANDRAFVARDGSSRDLGDVPGYLTSSARAINNKGQIVGLATTGGGIPRAVLWGTTRTLDPLAGDVASEATAINVNGEIVGRSGDSALRNRARSCGATAPRSTSSAISPNPAGRWPPRRRSTITARSSASARAADRCGRFC